MNNEETTKLIQEQLKTLPDNLRHAIESTDWKLILSDFLTQYTLSPEILAGIERETMLVIYGFENPLNLIENLTQQVPLEEEQAINIAELINERILNIIANKLETPLPPEILPQNLPMVEKGEVVHDVPPLTPAEKEVPQSNPSPASPLPPIAEAKKEEPTAPRPAAYVGGKDPYREPLV
jgi:hypothetical protein